MNNFLQSPLAKKILYGIVIVMSSLILVLSLVGILGVWAVQRSLGDAAVGVLQVIENTTGVLRQSGSRVDNALVRLEDISTEITDRADQLSQNVTDRGLVLLLLPEEQEQQLNVTASEARDTLAAVRESLVKGVELYNSINRLPFVDLPGPSAEQVENLTSTIEQVQALGQTLQSGIADFRSGVTDRVDQITRGASLLSSEISRIRTDLARLDAQLANLEAFAIRLQESIPAILLTIAVVLSLVFVFLIYSQIEILRLTLERWQHILPVQKLPPAESLEQKP